MELVFKFEVGRGVVKSERLRMTPALAWLIVQTLDRSYENVVCFEFDKPHQLEVQVWPDGVIEAASMRYGIRGQLSAGKLERLRALADEHMGGWSEAYYDWHPELNPYA